ncbi:hypothetical protein [Longimicrobium sp.]|uniref:hypothetical protein n=1 Tax=Longimicrobium sp. TaxID=2029185 RepID=UPI002BE0A755|nr:hypothetical protein [Longimicrobium sp.]HSU16224.1 hypothetical protein [Longimicrobium sp.]
MPAVLDSAALDSARAELEGIEGVRRAIIDGPPYTVWVIADAAHSPAEMLVHTVLTRHGLTPADATVQVCHAHAPEPRRRVRFISAKMDGLRTGRVTARVSLEWAGETHEGQVEGESGYALEMRSAALATIAALDGVIGKRVKFQLVGIKPFRAFDADVVVALMKSDLDGKSLIGAALTSDDPYRAAAVAVLNATNRVLGNYLSNEEDLSATSS